MRRACAVVLAAAALLAGQTESISALRQQAAAAFRDGRFTDAERALRRLLGQSPKDPAVLGFLGAVLDAQQRYDEAESAYKQALTQSSPSPALLNNVGNHYLAREQAEKARSYFERVLSVDSMNANANLQLARIATDQKQGGKALQYLSRIEDSDPAMRLLRGEALHWAGKRDEALGMLDKLARGAAGDPRVQFSLGMTFARLELYERAEAAFSSALVQRPTDFDVLYNLGRAAARAEHYDRAQHAFEVALKLQPGNVEALLELGRVYNARQDYDHAVYLLAQARKLAPTHAGALLALARAAEDGGYYQDSALAYDEYLQLRPGDDTVRRDRGLVYGYTVKRLNDGIRELTWYVQKHPEDPLGHYDLGVLSAAGSRPEQALEPLATVLRLSPGYAPAHYTRALVLHQLGRTPESVPDLQAMIRSNPDDILALDQLGLAYVTIGQAAEAEKVLRRALALAPEKPEILLHLGRALMHLGRRQEGKQLLDRFQIARSKKVSPARRPPDAIEFVGLPASEQKRRSVEAVRRSILAHPDDPDYRLRLGNLLLSEGRTAEAAGAFRELLAMNPDSRISLEAGASLFEYEQFAVAREFLERVAAENPAARLDLAIALFFTDGPAQALKVLAEIPSGELTGDCLLLKARLLDASGQTAEADRALQEGLRYSTTRPQVAYQAALLLIHHHRESEALSFLGQATRSMPASADLALINAIVLGLSNRASDAEKALKQIESRWPEWDHPYVVHGILLEQQRRPAEAQEKLQTAIALGSGDIAARCALSHLAGSPVPDPKCDCARGLYELLFPACGSATAKR